MPSPKKKALEKQRKCHRPVVVPEKFICAECGRVYRQRKNLNQHIKSKHSNEFLQCALCPFKSGRKYILQRHMESIHLPRCIQKKKKPKKKVDPAQKSEKKNLPPVRKFECTMCEKKFTKRSNLTRHVTFHHGDNKGEHLLVCAHCSKGFRDKNNLRKHVHLCEIKLQQAQSSAKVQLYTCLVSGCETVLNNQYAMLQHYKKVHDVVLEYESLEFDSKQQFDEWRAELQRTSAYQFCVSKVWKNSSSLNWRMQCHRTGKQPAEIENRQRFHKSSGSKKLNGFCPAEIFLKESKKDKTLHATIQKTHVGHCNNSHEELKFLSHMKEKSDTPSKHSKSMPLNTSLLSNQTATDQQVQQTEILNYDDIASIATVLGLNANYPSSYTDNAQNVSSFIDDHQQSILFYKAENSDDTEFGVLKNSDFALVFMSQFQRNLLSKFGDNVITYNATPRTNPNDFSLHSIMVLDDDCESVAVAFLLSNRNDGTVLELFLHSIKKHVGTLTPLTVITDVQTSFHYAFEVVMQAPPFSLWHLWHVFELWRKNQRRIKSSEKRKHVQMILYELSQMKDELTFQTELQIFMNDLDPDLESFIQYFRAKWLLNARYWAYCYRIAAKIDTNMINEPFHSFLKGKNCGRKKIRTVYQCLQCIEMYISIRENSNVMKTIKPQTQRTRKVRALQTRHHLAARSEDLYTIHPFPDVGDECRHTWLISSFEKEEKKRKTKIAKENDNSEYSSDEELREESISDGEECTKEENRLQLYVVQRHIDFIKQEVLCIECSICKVALEEYSCSCTDYLIKGNLCKHIHAVVIYCKKNGCQCTCGSQYGSRIEDIHNIEIKPKIERIHNIETKIEDIDNIEIDIEIDLDDDDDEGLSYVNHFEDSHDQEDGDALEDSIENLQSQVMKKIAGINDEETLKNVLQYISLNKNRSAPLEEKNESRDDVPWCYTYVDSNTCGTLEE